MKSDDYSADRTHSVLDRSEVEGVLSGSFYAPQRVRTKEKEIEKPAHYKVICISMYTGDLAKLDDMVDRLKAKGLTKASRSALIRYALATVDLDKVPRGI
jgi:hypothetical protein